MENIFNRIDNDLTLDTYGLDKDSCFLDIETTGLDRNRNNVYLIGIVYFDLHINSWVLQQIFADNLKEEREILLETAKILRMYDTIINYNGSSFDIPFLNSRFKLHNVDYFIDKKRSFDIYRMVRSNKKFLNLENLKLKTIERHLGIERDDMYSGKDCINFYYDYEASGNNSLKINILNHNMDDLIYLLDIISILDIIKTEKTFVVDSPNTDSSYDFCIEELDFEKSFLIVRGNTNKDFNRQVVYYDSNYSLEIDNDEFLISIETNKASLKSEKIGQFVYLKDYIHGHENQALVLSVERNFVIDNIKILLKILIEKSI